ncbi:MAG: hypothetical protein PHU42_01760 [Patescibacteria group bacterium]|nr:hypothetical protein [Patescibacteria group bacterium]
MKSNKHRPFHLELENEVYFLTTRCFEKKNYFSGREGIILNIINNLIKELGISLYAFAIMKNHYHLLLKLNSIEDDTLTGVTPNTNSGMLDFLENPWNDSRKAVKQKKISYFANRLNSSIARVLNKMDDCEGRKVFYQYWDYCIRGERDFFKIFNYIHQNPIKHGLVKNFEELENFNFCSYKHWLTKRGKDFLFDCFYYYPANDINIED